MMATLVGELHLSREAAYVGDARTGVRKLAEQILGYARDPDLEDVAEDIALAADELVTNAVRYGAGGEVTIRVLEIGNWIRVEVHDVGTAPIEAAEPDLWAETGRGLFIVGAVTEAHGFIQDAAGTTAWFEKHR